MTETLLYSIYVALMVPTALLIAYWWARKPQRVHAEEYFVHLLIPVWSGAAYLALALDQGKIPIEGQITYLPRYVDWAVTTPLALVALAMTGMYRRHMDKTLTFGMVSAQFFMILAVLVADLSVTPARFVWFALGCAGLGAVLWMIWFPLRHASEGQEAPFHRHFLHSAGFLSVLWVAYPLFWLIGPSGLAVVGEVADTALFVGLPAVTRAGWTLYDMYGLRSLKGA